MSDTVTAPTSDKSSGTYRVELAVALHQHDGLQIVYTDDGTDPVVVSASSTMVRSAGTITATRWRCICEAPDGTIYAATDTPESHIIAKSVDGGVTFQAVATIPEVTSSTVHYWTACCAVGNAVLFGIYGGGVYRTTDGGVSWELIPDMTGYWFTAAVVGSDIVLLGSIGNGLWRSDDAGATWIHVTSAPSRCHAIASSPDVVYLYEGTAGEDGRVWRSLDLGMTFTATQSPLLRWTAGCVGSDQTVYACAFGGSIYASRDRGDTWHITSSVTAAWYGTATVAGDGSLLFTGLNSKIYITRNNFATDLEVLDDIPRQYSAILVTTSGVVLGVNTEVAYTNDTESGTYSGVFHSRVFSITNGMPYRGPITIKKSTTIKAVVTNSSIASWHYIITGANTGYVGYAGSWHRIANVYVAANGVWKRAQLSVGRSGTWNDS